MTTILCLGHGYCAQRFIALHGKDFSCRIGTSRTGTPRADMEMLAFGGEPSDELIEAVRRADVVLASAAPGEAGDPFLATLGDALGAATGRGALVYLSTIGVYGDSRGEWIDESAPVAGSAARARRRIEAENAWLALGERSGRPVSLLRLGGIYGPGRNALIDLAQGKARCIEREGQVFNRIHVDDIAGAIHSAIHAAEGGVVNVVDDEPSASCAPIRYAAGLMDLPPPPAEPFEEASAAMSAMALSFWADNRRVRNERLHARLGGPLAFPTYREGLSALFAAGEGASSAG